MNASRGKGRIGIHVAGIEVVSIGCGFQRCSRPFAVATVPLRHLGKNARLYSVGTRARNSWYRRSTRASRLAVTNNFTGASGQITVPMSRPSSTAPDA